MRYTLARGLSEPVEKPDVILVGNGRRLVSVRGRPTPGQVVNQKEIKFTEVSLSKFVMIEKSVSGCPKTKIALHHISLKRNITKWSCCIA